MSLATGTRSPVRVGLIGLGRMGRNHLRVLSMLRGVELVWVADADEAAAGQAAARTGSRVARTPREYTQGVDAVVVCTPTSTHAQYVRQLAPAVRNIFVEKPLAASVDDARDIEALVHRHGLNLQVGFIERYNPAVLALQRVLGSGDRVISIDFTRTNKLSARITDVDVIFDLMIHDIDLALHLNGPARAVDAVGHGSGNLIDFASAQIRHVNGRFSRIQASRITDRKARSIQATCSDMFVDCELLRKEIVVSRQSEIRQEAGQPYTVASLQELVEVPQQEALLSELQAFIGSCSPDVGGGAHLPARPDAAQSVQTLELCERVQQGVLT